MATNLNAGGQVSRSGRAIKRPRRLEDEQTELPRPKARKSRVDQAQAHDRTFLAGLYAQINAAAVNTDPALLPLIVSDIRVARTARFWDQLPLARRAEYRQFITNLNQGRFGVAFAARQNIKADIIRMLTLRSTRIDAFLDYFGFPLLIICLHAQIFRHALEADDASEQVLFQQKLTLIEQNASSLELFGRTRGIEWQTALSASHEHFDIIERRVLNALMLQDVGALGEVAADSFGIKDPDLRQRHKSIRDDAPNPYLYAVPIDGSAEPCQIEYTVTADSADATNPVGTRMRVRQTQINDSEFLQGYHWPLRRDWPQPDEPRYAGFVQDPCLVCDRTNDLISKRTTGKIVNYAPVCRCTLSEYQELRSLSENSLLELFTTPRMGTGVRALESIRTGQVLGQYVGEIYPAVMKGSRSVVPLRYGDPEGGCYIARQAILRRHPVSAAKSEDPAPLNDTEYSSMHIDAAIKGSWTRFINHSCDYNTVFVEQNIGSKNLMLVRADRDIEFGEEITIDYTKDFFLAKTFGCRCGSACCTLYDTAKNQDLTNANRVRLDQALKINPKPACLDWVTDAEGVPFAVPKAEATRKLNARFRRN